MSKFKTMDEITADLDRMEISITELTRGIMEQNTFSKWKKRGLPSSIIKYKKLLDRLENLKARIDIEKEVEQNCSDWTASNKHGV